jgi:hypothetical protein
MKKYLVDFAYFVAFASLLSLPVACGDDGDGSRPKPGSNVRVIHASYDAPAVDVTLSSASDEVLFGGLVYGRASAYDRVGFNGTAALTPAGADQPELATGSFNLRDGDNQTFLAVDQAAAAKLIGAVDDRSAPADKAKVRFIHASPDAPAVDIKLDTGDGPIVFDDTQFEGITEYVEVDPGPYTFVVTAADDNIALITFDPVTLQAATVYTVVALGTFDAGDEFPFFVRVFVDSGDGDFFVDLTDSAIDLANLMVIHASPDAPAVDIFSDGIFQGSISFPENTEYIALPAGTRSIKVNVGGTDTTAIGPVDLNLLADTFTSVFAYDLVAIIDALVLSDDLTAPAAGKAKVRFVHLSPDAPAVDVALAASGPVLFPDYEFGEFSPFDEFDVGTVDLEVRLAGQPDVVLSLPGVTLEDGKIYTVFANGLVAPAQGEPPLAAYIILNN